MKRLNYAKFFYSLSGAIVLASTTYTTSIQNESITQHLSIGTFASMSLVFSIALSIFLLSIANFIKPLLKWNIFVIILILIPFTMLFFLDVQFYVE